MSILKTIGRPFTKFISHLKTVNEQVYCGDSEDCSSLKYTRGNLNQDIPPRVSVWNSCALTNDAHTPVDGIPADTQEMKRPATP